ncbi:MAG: DNA polymerase/3'-5' exonuclease PolX [Verrucomicrobia bacterium]|nr:DNA polymerase/3'-5' exonuclease PolX [Verrucomicrobiota bacterium]
MDKERVAAILNEIGVLLELKGENPFKTRAYANAARALEGLSEPLDRLVEENRLGEIKGIGESIRRKIEELVRSGRLPYYEELKASVPEGLLELLQIPGMGPRKVRAVYEKLGVAGLDELERACRDGRVAQLPGFGARTAEKILEGIRFRRERASRFHLHQALAVAESIYEALRNRPETIRCSVAGSLRRRRETIGDLDFIVASEKPKAALDFFVRLPGVRSVLAHGETKASVRLEEGIQADLRVVRDEEYPFALAYFTGSKEHNIALRQRAIQRGMRLNEYGLFRGEGEGRQGERVACRDEEAIYRALDLAYIPPELRENQGEIEAAEKGRLPELLRPEQLRGSLHNHSDWSDGRQTLEQIARMIDELGFEYWGVTDHSRSSFQANGLDAKRLRRQLEAVRKLNEERAARGRKGRLLTGIEVDILKDRLDFPDEILAELEVVVASLHVAGGDEAENTRRLIMAAENPFVHMLGHPTGRLLLTREPYKINVQAVIDACAETGTWIELNAHPYRLDLDWRWWLYARKKGVRCAVNCDAHRAEEAAFLALGAGVARKGWLTAQDVVNTLPLKRLRAELRRKRAGKG